MAKLEGQKIADSYEQLLHTDRDGGGNGTTLVDIKDGKNDNTFALKLATDKAEIDGKLTIDQDSDVTALDIDTEATTAAGLNFSNPAQTTGNVILLDSANNLTTGRLAFLGSNSSDNSTRNLVEIVNEHASATGATALKIRQDSTAPALVALGNVGIGGTPVTTYGTNLTVKTSSSSSSPALTLANTATDIGDGGTVGAIEAQAGAGNRIGGILFRQEGTSANSGDISFHTSSSGSLTEKMRLLSDGKLGLGVSPTHAKMEIVGDADAFQLTMSDVADSDNATKEARIGMLHYKQAEEPVTLMYAQSGSSTNSIFIGGGTGVGNHATSVNIATASTYNSTSTTTNMVIDNNSRISLSNNDSGTGNTVFGSIAADDLTSNAEYNSFYGHNSGHAVTTGDYNVGIGMNTIDGATNPQRVVAIGSAAIRGNATADAIGAVAVGYASLNVLTSGAKNVAIGYESGDSITSGGENTLVGYSAGGNFDTNAGNTAIGSEALSGASDASYCVAVGKETLKGSLTSAANGSVAVGSNALFALTSGAANTAIGYQALDAEDAGGNNVAVGYQALTNQNNDNGMNTAVGKASGAAITTGHSNTLVGSGSGATLQSGYQNTLIGRDADATSGKINATAVGYGTIAQADDSVTLGNAAVSDVYMASDSGATVHCAGIIHTQENVTISSDAITVTSSYVRVNTESNASSDELATINGGSAGQVLYLHQQFSTRDVTLKDGTGNLALAGDFAMDHAQDMIHLIYSAADSVWIEVSRSNNA